MLAESMKADKGVLFRNREQVAHLLVEKLTQYRGQTPLVLAIPRGAVPMARIIADALGGEVDVVLVHKLGAPGNPEFAIGSVSETGDVYTSDDARAMGISQDYIAREVQAQRETLRHRRAIYTPTRSCIEPFNRIVIIVDDGIATGATMIAALRSIRANKPAKLIAAVGVAPPDTLERIAKVAEEVVCLATPPNFYAVGQFFQDFSQVSDEEVMAILKQTPKQSRTPPK